MTKLKRLWLRQRILWHSSSNQFKLFIQISWLLSFFIFLYYHTSPSSHERLEENIHQKAQNLRKVATHILPTKPSNYKAPDRLIHLLHQDLIVGDRLVDIQSGTLTIDEVIHKKYNNQIESTKKKSPMTIDEVLDFLSNFLRELHLACTSKKTATYEEIWKIYHDLTIKTLYPWDREYLERMPERRFDDSIFLSLASYRDENCLSTITNAYAKSKNPEKLFVGLVQQNCDANCRSGVLKNGSIVDIEPDEDCHKLFCESPEGKRFCDAGQVRALHVQESESLGPYAARFFASKLWNGEQWYMQIDSHMTFGKHWDATSVEMLLNAPSKKPVISHYPPSENENLDPIILQTAPRLCHAIFADSEIESQIIRLQGVGNYVKYSKTPRFAPFVAAGYFVAHSDILREVPFDPFLPWIFMGEEIIMSARFWTHGYDIFSPTQSVVGHIYVRRHKPKFWESVHRVFHHGVHNPLQMMILDRVKYQLGYPEAARDMLKNKSVLTAVEQYTMGKERLLVDYLEMAGLDMTTKEVIKNTWCNQGIPPKGFEKFTDLYVD